MVRKRVMLLLASSLIVGLPAIAWSQPAIEEISGTFADGTRWVARKPANWNGTLLLDLDGAGFLARAQESTQGAASAARPAAAPTRPASAFNDWLYSQGYALGGTTREPVGYDFPKAADYLLDGRRRFIDKWGEPKRTLASGVSRGAFAVRMNLELYPGIYDGGIMSAGGGAGEIAVLNNKLNSLFVLKTLV